MIDAKRLEEIERRASMTTVEALALYTTDDWGTPKALCDELGRFDLDPCSNSRSHVNAETSFVFECELIARDAEGLASDAEVSGLVDRAAMLREQAAEIREQMSCQTDGLTVPWAGSVFCNPPYSDPLPWAVKLAAYNQPWCALLKLDTTTRWWATLMSCSPAWAPFRHRLKFEQPGKAMTANFASVLVWSRWRPGHDLAQRLWLPTYARAA